MKRFTASPRTFLAALTVAGFALTGCDSQEDVRVYDAPKPGTGDSKPAAAPATPAAGDYTKPAADAKPALGAPTWAVPAGWKQVANPNTMRFATFQVSEKNPTVQMSVMSLPPQGLVENINRWEGELGNPPSSAEKVQELVKKQEIGGTEGYVADLTGPGKTPGGPKMRTLAAMVNRGRQVWFFKLMGPDEVIAEQKASFDLFIQSVKFEGGQSLWQGQALVPVLVAATTGSLQPLILHGQEYLPMPSVQTLAAEEGEKITKYVAPKGWEEDKTPRMMRVMTFFVKDGDKQAELSVLKLGADSYGGLLANVNRWRQQVGAPPIAEINEKEIPKVTISGKEAYLFEFVGPNEKEPTKRMYITLGVRGSDVYFFKLLGDAALVAAQKENFNAFLKSVEFGK